MSHQFTKNQPDPQATGRRLPIEQFAVDDLIDNAQEHVHAAIANLEAAYRKLTDQPIPPEGRSRQYRALATVLSDRMAAARKLQADLLEL